MKKRYMLFTVVLALGLVMSGCGSDTVVADYPDGGTNAAKSSKESTTDNSEESNAENIKAVGDKITCEVTNSKGSVAYEINAEKIGDEKEEYPMVQVQYRDFTDEYVREVAKAIFEPGSISILMPYEVASSDYVNLRIDELERRAQTFDAEDVKSRLYIEQELNELYKLRDRNKFDDKMIIDTPAEPSLIDLDEYFASKGMSESGVNCCILEGIIGEDYYRLDFLTIANTRLIKLFREKSNEGYAEAYMLLNKDETGVEESDGDPITPEGAQDMFTDYMNKFDIGSSEMIDTYPVNIFGSMENQFLRYQKPGYICFASPVISGRTIPVSQDTTIFSGSNRGRFLMIASQYLPEIVNHKEVFNMIAAEKEKGSGVYYNGYTGYAGCFDNKGPIELCIANLMDNSEQLSENVQSTPMISFEEVNDRAIKYLTYLADHPNRTSSNKIKHTISRIELGMCRAVSNDSYYLVPAWYYMQDAENNSVLPIPVAVVNAIDGTIIDVQSGGVAVDFQ